METLKKFKTFVDEIIADNSRNYKLAVLEKYKYDEDVKYYLNYIYDPYKITGISDKKLYKKFQDSILLDTMKSYTIKEILEYILENNTGTDATIQLVQELKKCIAPELIPLFDKIVTKNLQLGINVTSINKVIPKLIPEFSVQLANKYFDKPEIVEGHEFAITTKIDGMRCIMMKENGNVTFWSRQGQLIEGLVDLEEEAKKCFEDDIVLDGELIAKQTTKEDTYKTTMKTARTKDVEKHNLKMMVFDCLSIEEFKTQTCKDCYEIRRDNLMVYFTRYNTEHYWNINKTLPVDMYHNRRTEWRNLIYSEINKEYKYFELLPILYQGTDTNKIEEILKEQVANGEEGIMINLTDTRYEFKRTNNLLKVKLFNSCDLRIMGFEAGTNKNVNTLGALLLEYKNNIVKCGSGFTDEQRKEIWNNQDKYLNTIVEVTYFEETENSAGDKSLRFPIFKDFRFDKVDPNY